MRANQRWRRSSHEYCLVLAAIAVVFTAAPPAATGVPQPVKLTLVHWLSAGPSGDRLTARVQSFERKYPNVSVEQEMVPFGQYFAKVGAYIATNDGPDVMMAQGGQSHLDWKNSLVAIDGHIADIKANVSGWLPGVNYGVPMTLQAHLLYYRKDVLRTAGLDPDRPPRTWRDMEETCAKVRASGKHCIMVGGKDILHLILWWLLQMTATERDLSGLATGTSKFTDPPLEGALRLFEEMVKKRWLDPSLADVDRTQAFERFTKGEAAFMQGLIGDAEDWQRLSTAFGGNDKFGEILQPLIQTTYPLPGLTVSPEASKINVGTGILFVVPKWSRRQPEAILLAKSFADPLFQLGLARGGGSFPAATIAKAMVGSPHYAQISDWVRQGKAIPAWQLRPNSAPPAMLAQAQLLLLGKTSPADSARAIQAAIDRAR